MASMRAPDGSDIACVARGGQPIVDGSANPPPLDRRLAWPMMTGDQKNDPVASRNRLVEAAIDGGPRGVEIHSVEVYDPVRNYRATAELLVPASIKRLLAEWDGP
jgi:hypothetical protein